MMWHAIIKNRIDRLAMRYFGKPKVNVSGSTRKTKVRNWNKNQINYWEWWQEAFTFSHHASCGVKHGGTWFKKWAGRERGQFWVRLSSLKDNEYLWMVEQDGWYK
jgi:hypothetical protein